MMMMMDALLLSSANVFFAHYLLPSFSMNEVRVAENELRDFIMRHQSDEASTAATVIAPVHHHSSFISMSTMSAVFDSSEFFFVSKRVARACPHLPESQWILTYSTPWPRHSYAHGMNDAHQVVQQQQHDESSRMMEAVVAHVLSVVRDCISDCGLHDIRAAALE